MLAFNGKAFYEATTEMAFLRAAIADRKSTSLVDGGVEISHITDAPTIFSLSRGAKSLQNSVLVLGARNTATAVHRLLETLSRHPTWEALRELYRDIDSRLQDELGDTTVLVLERGDQAYYEPKAPLFGSDVAAKFGSASYDIEEAGKCLALGRSTAGAFTLWCLEAGSWRFRCLGSHDSRNWGDATSPQGRIRSPLAA